GGRFSPGLRCSGGLSPGPFCACMFSLCSQGFPPEKHAEEQIALLSLTRTGHEHLAWSPGAIKAAHCSWLPLRKDSSDGIKAGVEFMATSGLCVCCLGSLIYYAAV